MLTVEEAIPVLQEQRAVVSEIVPPMTVAFLADEEPMGDFACLTPNAVKTLIDNQVRVYMQRGFAHHSLYSDMDYADVGAEFEDEFVRLASLSGLLVKFTPFTVEQVRQMRVGQVVLSTQPPAQITRQMIEELNRKRVSALAMNLITDANGTSMTDRILTETLSEPAVGIALSGFILPLVLDILLNPHFRFALQRTPALMQSVYCYGGFLCNRDMAELLDLPWRDIVSLCWDLN